MKSFACMIDVCVIQNVRLLRAMGCQHIGFFKKILYLFVPELWQQELTIH